MNTDHPRGPVFAIGDVHGCSVELQRLLQQLPLTADSVVVFLGDYVDRGTDSRGVIDVALDLANECHVVYLMGNHEEMFLAFLEDPDSKRGAEFIMNGGSSTLANYADDRGTFEVPHKHRQFLRDLRLCYQTETHFFVHAGVPDLPLERIDPVKHAAFLLWSRANFLRSTFTWEKTIVHGHTPVQSVEFHPRRINVDTG